MAWFSRHKESPERKALREEFEAAMSLLAQAGEPQQVAVGHRINLVTATFATQYPSLETFEAAPPGEKLKCLESLTAMEQDLNSKEVGSGLGVGLFKMWLGAVVAQDEPLVQAFSEGLAQLSAKAVSSHKVSGR